MNCRCASIFNQAKFFSAANVCNVLILAKRGLATFWAIFSQTHLVTPTRTQDPVFHFQEPACAVTGEGLDVGLESLLQLIVKRKKIGKRARNKTR
jgi:hypothetical protein